MPDKSPIPEFPLTIIHPSPLNPRKHFATDLLEDLANSIRLFGVQQPITVRPLPKERRTPETEHDFEIVLGERRWHAAQIAGLERIPIIVREMSDAEMVREALCENLNRADLSPIEEARGYQMALATSPGMTQEALAKQFGKTQSHVSKYLSLLDLPEEVQRQILKGQLSASHGVVLAGLSEDPEIQKSLAGMAVVGDMPVASLAAAVADEKRKKEAAKQVLALPFEKPEEDKEEPKEAKPAPSAPKVEPPKPAAPAAAPSPAPPAVTAPTPVPAVPAAPAPVVEPAEQVIPAPVTSPDGPRVSATILQSVDDWLFEQDLTLDKALEELVRYRVSWKAKLNLDQIRTYFNHKHNTDLSLSDALEMTISCHLAILKKETETNV